MEENLQLQTRLRNCLQTILDLEDELSGSMFGVTFLKELKLISGFVGEIGRYKLSEPDVARIEEATGNFLRELDSIFAKRKGAAGQTPRYGVQ